MGLTHVEKRLTSTLAQAYFHDGFNRFWHIRFC